ncbi:hypothetical protein EBX31_12690 [bacterium]|nr:hypothetical protein [bacterium]
MRNDQPCFFFFECFFLGSDLDFFEEDAFLPCFLVVAGFFFWAVTGSDAEGAEGVGVGAGAE